jgi:hypothetical protein
MKTMKCKYLSRQLFGLIMAISNEELRNNLLELSLITVEVWISSTKKNQTEEIKEFKYCIIDSTSFTTKFNMGDF